MRIGTAALVVGLALALAGCGGANAHPSAHKLMHDSVVTASDSVAAPFGPGSNPHRVVPADLPEQDDDVVRQPPALPTCPEGTTVHFSTPQAAMTYLAAAWNRNDLAALCQVTNPNSRFLLNDMHSEAVNLQLKKCEYVAVGLYSCTFTHDYPKHMHAKGHGKTWLEVAAADNPGWYLLDYVGCG